MTSAIPTHLVATIKARIAWLREAWQVDAVYAQPIPQFSDYPLIAQRREHRNHRGESTPTFPSPQNDEARSKR